MFVSRVLANNSFTKFRRAEIQITGIEKHKIENYQKAKFRKTELPITEILIAEIQKATILKFRNTNYRITEMLSFKSLSITQSSPLIHI